ncbi:beta-propeller domain-containing protein [Candidatus Venteria ishoeyi]|uniref:Beta propeller domain protein n=1 Tax=Candidatus Venteria ishoeyi TaxID=1899563 RepID=A0A1H6FAN8_9GAMM|nr:beta-propeller domain-containing protein [Candidatus Venteria ishoeyi]SEH06206.1 Beta propeller domain protein [Candidatus Venteria ishoeyi]
MKALSGIALFCLLFTQALAWELDVKPDNQENPHNQVWVGSDQALSGVEPYLTWFDMDAKPGAQFQSWQAHHGWSNGLHHIFPNAVDLPVFEAFPITTLASTCPVEHRCFLAFLALPPGASPLNPSVWQEGALFPLSIEAGYERMPGQVKFLSESDYRFYDNYRPGLESGVMDDAVLAPTIDAAPMEDKDNTGAVDGGATVETEKPDIFQVENHQLWYVNQRAKKLQIIDLSDPATPSLTTSLRLQGYPEELYLLNGRAIILQADQDKARLDVIQMDVNGELKLQQSLELPGYFMESRRRNARIYVISRVHQEVIAQEPQPVDGIAPDVTDVALVCCHYPVEQLATYAVELDSAGQLNLVDQAQNDVYSPQVAIFNDYLVLAGRNPQDWRSSQVQVFNLSQDQDALVDAGLLKVPGYIPSEFHLNVSNNLFRLVYGSEDRSAGSTLGIYDLQSTDLPLLGKVSDIAPGEALFATRFVKDTAYVVTYERTDPLWVIDLSNPAQPVITGELEVPGWSEKLFFNNNRLFSTGIDDQPGTTEATARVRRFSMSLFDVADPHQLSLLDRLTPFKDTPVNYSYSPSTEDERALLLDWNSGLVAAPVNSYQAEQQNYLQIARLQNNEFKDMGLLALDVPAERGLLLEPDILGILSGQSLLTASVLNDEPKLLGELELAKNITWLQLAYDAQAKPHLWAAAYGDSGYYRFYDYDIGDTNDAEPQPRQHWNLDKPLRQIALGAENVVFYQNSPLSLQALNLETGELSPVFASDTENNAYQQSAGFVVGDNFYFSASHEANIRPLLMASEPVVKPNMTDDLSSGMPEDMYYYPTALEWQLQHFSLTPEVIKEHSALSIPGILIAAYPGPLFVTQEKPKRWNDAMALNLLTLDNKQLRMLDSLRIEQCDYYTTTYTTQGLYVTCSIAMPVNIVGTNMTNGFAPEYGRQTHIFHFQITDQQLKESGHWVFDGQWYIRAAKDQRVLLHKQAVYYYDVMWPTPTTDNADICQVYVLNDKQAPQLQGTVNHCHDTRKSAIGTQQVYHAAGFAEITAEPINPPMIQVP